MTTAGGWAYNVYGKVQRSLGEFRKFLVETVDPVYLDGYLDETLRLTLKRIEKLLKPSPSYRWRTSPLLFEKVNQGPGAEGPAKWTAAWLAEAEKAVQTGYISMLDAKKHFLQHVFVLDREWF